MNADKSSIISDYAFSLTDKNVYLYCDNNPVMRTDRSGDAWYVIVGYACLGFLDVYLTDVIKNIEDDGFDYSDFCLKNCESSVGEYVGSVLSSMIPGSNVGSAVLRIAMNVGSKYLVDGLLEPRENQGSFGALAKDIGLGILSEVVNIGIDKVFVSLGFANYSNKIHPLTKGISSQAAQDVIHTVTSVALNCVEFLFNRSTGIVFNMLGR